MVAAYLRARGLWGTDVCLSGAPYNEAPTASNHLAADVAFRLNDWLSGEDRRPVRTFQITKRNAALGDYALLSREERTALLAPSPFSCDPAFLRDRNVLILDDLRITGANEMRMRTMFEGYGLPPPAFAYYAVLDSSAGASPTVEHQLNHALVRADGSTLPEFLQARQSPCSMAIQLNVRLAKAMLGLDAPSFAHCLQIVRDPAFLPLLYRYALGEGYHLHRRFSANVQLLRRRVETPR
jgi:hypothetical protein